MPEKSGGLNADMTPEAGFRRVAAMCCDAFSAQLAQVLTEDDPEGPHRARVALRRFRSALAGFSPVIDPTARREMAGQARVLFRCLGRLRDADVLLAGCLDPTAVEGLATNADRVRAEVRAELTTLDAQAFAGNIRTRLLGSTWLRRDRRGRRWHRRGLDRLGQRALEHAWQACVGHGRDLTSLAPTTRHEMRKKLKTLRYLSEYFAPFWPGRRRDRFLVHLRDLQDNLGLLNDLELARALDPVSPDAQTPSQAETILLAAAARSWRSLLRSDPWWDQATRRP